MASANVGSPAASAGLSARRLSARELAFFHRVFQEFLAATYIAHVDVEQQQAMVTEHVADPAWREVLFCACLDDKPAPRHRWRDSMDSRSSGFQWIRA